ncbi:AraC family transcriptional regulator [Bradyrhizobium quebecense]|uniref:AraC family transcriptional regulator n=2 Tax=Bradyrhizobium quebecense TaxID=2748629 RepID=A0ABS3MC44_9BRAD|nr:helix-turn-helix domain-containing protein [Bradyrhizobium quebecense]UGY04314.1 helix-turn-helix domain-containing protein [Bradyrhizobium quebecense]
MMRISVTEGSVCQARLDRVDSIEALGNPIDKSQIEIVQLGRGRMCGEILRGQIDDVAFSKGAFSLPARATGVFSAEKMVFGAVLGCAGPSRSLGEAVVAGDLLVYPAGGEHDRVYEGSATFAGLACAPSVISTFFASEPELADPEFWAKRRHFRFSNPARPRTLERILDLLGRRLRDEKTFTQAGVEFWRRALLEAFVGRIAFEPRSGTERTIPSSVRIVKEAEQYLKENGDRAVHVSELCEKIKIRRRTLFRAFDDAVGRAPIDFLRAKRLSMAHLKLCEAEVGGASVAEIAGELGFLELGRFAQQYRNLFGECPSETLRRSSGSRGRRSAGKKGRPHRTIWHDSHNGRADPSLA